jgi:hypothetical protein
MCDRFKYSILNYGSCGGTKVHKLFPSQNKLWRTAGFVASVPTVQPPVTPLLGQHTAAILKFKVVFALESVLEFAPNILKECTNLMKKYVPRQKNKI